MGDEQDLVSKAGASRGATVVVNFVHTFAAIPT